MFCVSWLSRGCLFDMNAVRGLSNFSGLQKQAKIKRFCLGLTNRTTVEAFLKAKRMASHIRSYQKGGYYTLKEHMPKAHQSYLDWTPQRLIRWAAKIGPSFTHASSAGKAPARYLSFHSRRRFQRDPPVVRIIGYPLTRHPI